MYSKFQILQKMKKVILLVRVSTKYQDYKAQKKELIDFAKRDGYKVSEMEIIEDKESATKLSDEERQGLNKMFKAINDTSNQIECVYCWELSRLSRKPETLYRVKNFLIEHKIDLRIKDKNFRLFNDNREVDATSELVFGIYISFCENEINQKVQRAMRAKKANASLGIYNGGIIKYGYAVNKDNTYKKHKEQSEIIKLIFELYSTGKYGFNKLHKEILSRGKSVDIRKIGKILRSREYTGETIEEHKTNERIKGKTRIITRYTRAYPPIISTELFEKCREVAKSNNSNIDKSKTIYYANKLIKCNHCTGYLVALKNRVGYRCMNKYSPLTKTDCGGNDSININVIDSVLWNTAKSLEVYFILHFDDQQFTEWNNQISLLQSKIDNSENQYNIIVEKKFKDLRKSIASMSDEQLKNIAINETKTDKQQIEQEKVKYQLEIERLQKLKLEIEKKYTPTTTISENPSLAEVNKTLKQLSKNRAEIEKEVDKADDKKRYEIIHNHIKEVRITNVPEMVATKKIAITLWENMFLKYEVPPQGLTPTNECVQELYYAYRLKDKTKQLFHFLNGEKFYHDIKIEQRFTKNSKIKQVVK